jgi:hypothetical protein
MADSYEFTYFLPGKWDITPVAGVPPIATGSYVIDGHGYYAVSGTPGSYAIAVQPPAPALSNGVHSVELAKKGVEMGETT